MSSQYLKGEHSPRLFHGSERGRELGKVLSLPL